MSYALQLRDALTLAASTVQGDKRLGRIARDAAADVMLEADILPTMQAAVSLIIALEDEAHAATEAAKRAWLATMASSLATSTRLGYSRVLTHWPASSHGTE